MKFKPHQYQEYAIQHVMKNAAAGLFLDMGLGKTVCALTATADLLHDYFDIAKVLVIAPLRVAEGTWGNEVNKWDHLRYLRVSKILGPEKDRIQALNARADIYVINVDNLPWLCEQYGEFIEKDRPKSEEDKPKKRLWVWRKKWPFDMVIMDEMSLFKNQDTVRFEMMRRTRPFVKRLIGLTGTPAPNGLLDLWPQMYLLDRGARLGQTITGYRYRYFKPGKRNKKGKIYQYIPWPESEKAIHEKISDICISMKAADWLELPERINNIISLKLQPKTREKYKQLERDLLLPFVGGDVVANTAAILSNKLLQLANGAVYDENRGVQVLHNEKLEALEEIIETSNGQPVLVFYSYLHDLARLKEHLKKYNPRELLKNTDIEDWNTGKIQVLLAHPASAGHGLNLQAGGHIIVWFGLTWSLERYLQANARLDRQGQQNGVIVHHLLAEGTIDEDVMEALTGKAKTQDALLEAVKARIERLGGGQRGGG